MKKISLKEVATFSTKRGICKELDIATYVTTDNLLQNKAGVSIANGVPPKGESFPKYEVDNILVSNIRPYLKKIWFADREGISSSDVLVVSAQKGYFPKFVYYSLFNDLFFDHMMKGAKGTKMPRGDKNQIKIADVLSSIDNKISLNNKINDNLEQMAKAIYDYWFVQFDFPNTDGKPYKSSGGEMVYDDVLKRQIPKGWQVKSLLDIANFVNGLACQKYRPIDENFLPVIKIREMNDGISQNTEKVRKDIPSKYIINDGDLLFSWSASLDVKIWSDGTGALNQHIFRVTSSTYPKTYYYFELLNYLRHFKMMADLRKTTMGHITQEHLRDSKILVPSLNIINKLDEQLKPIFKKILITKKQSQELAALRDWLLPMLMNGQVTVKLL